MGGNKKLALRQGLPLLANYGVSLIGGYPLLICYQLVPRFSNSKYGFIRKNK